MLNVVENLFAGTDVLNPTVAFMSWSGVSCFNVLGSLDKSFKTFCVNAADISVVIEFCLSLNVVYLVASDVKNDPQAPLPLDFISNIPLLK